MEYQIKNNGNSYFLEIMTSYNPASMRNKSNYEIILERLKIYAHLTECTSATLFSLDPETSEFYYRTSTSLHLENELKTLFDELVDAGAIAEALRKSVIVESGQYEIEGKKMYCLIIPLIISTGVIGINILTIPHSLKNNITLLKYCEQHANNFALILHCSSLSSELQHVKESAEQKIAYRTRDVVKTTREMKKILDSVQTGIIILDASTGNITDANTMALNLIGIKKEDLIAQKKDDYFFSIEGSRSTDRVITNKEGVLRRNTGEVIPIIRNETEISLSGSDYVIVSFFDITERKNAEELLRLSEHKFRTVADYTFDWEYWESENMQFNYISPSCHRITGYTPSEFNDNPDLLEEIIHPDDRDYFRAHHSKVFSSEHRDEMDDLEIKIIKKNGSIAFINHICRPIYDENNNYLGRRISNKDITERKFVEREIRESEEKYRKLTETASDSIISVDSFGQIISWNSSAEKMFGFTFEEVEGKSIEIIIPQTNKLSARNGTHKVSASHESWTLGKVINIEGVRKNKTVFPIELSLSSWESEDSVFYTAIIRDITERVIIEQELLTYRTDLEELVRARTEELDKVNELLKIEIEKEKELSVIIQNSLEKEKKLNDLKSRFLSITSHEFRTPLSSVLSSAELIQMYGKTWSDDKIEVHFQRIKSSIQYLVKLLDEVLTISKAEKGNIVLNPTLVDFKTVALGYIEEAKMHNGKHSVNLNYMTGKNEFSLDPNLMKFMVSNLLSNAIKYSPDGGNVELTISTDSDYLIIEVKDEGIGIAESELEYIFQSFYRSKNADGIPGTGLGLSIVQLAVDLHGGEIIVNSKIGEGTTFVVKLPIRAD